MFGLLSVILFEKTRSTFVKNKADKRALMVSLDEGTFAAIDWSWGGCCLTGYHGKKRVGDEFVINAVRSISGRATRPFIRARVVAKSWYRKELSVIFVELGEAGGRLVANILSEQAERRAQTKLARQSKTRPRPKWMTLRSGGQTTG